MQFDESKSDNPYAEELTVFIIVNIESLKALSKSIELRLSKIVRVKRDIMNTIIVKKYLTTPSMYLSGVTKRASITLTNGDPWLLHF